MRRLSYVSRPPKQCMASLPPVLQQQRFGYKQDCGWSNYFILGGLEFEEKSEHFDLVHEVHRHPRLPKIFYQNQISLVHSGGFSNQ